MGMRLTCFLIGLALGYLAMPAYAQSVSLSPAAMLQFFDNAGHFLSGGKLYTYSAGTNTKLATYVDSAGVTANTNPVVLNTRGEANVWLTTTSAYKFVLSPSTDTDPPSNAIWTVDNVGVGNIGGGIFEWSALQHQNQGGGNNCAHRLQWVDQHGLICGDHFAVSTQDASMLIRVIGSGTVVAGQIVGFTGVVAGVTWTVKYTIQSADGTIGNVLQGVFNCMLTQTNAGCTVSGGQGTLLQALAAYKRPGDNIGFNATNGGLTGPTALALDWPWGGNDSADQFGGNTVTAISSASLTLTVLIPI